MPFDASSAALIPDRQPAAAAVTFDSFAGDENPFLIVSYGLGRDSTGLLILLSWLGIRPDLILFVDLGAEKDATYAFLPIMNCYLRSVGFPEVTVIQLNRRRDRDFETHLFRLGVFASLTYGQHKCSATWKIEAQDEFLSTYAPVIEARRAGRIVVRAVGFEAGEEYRAERGRKRKSDDDTRGSKTSGGAFAPPETSEYATWFPLIEQKMDFDQVCDAIWRAGLPLPPKSSCYFCASMREIEIYNLSQTEPHKFFRALVLERLAQRNQVVPHTGRVQGIAFGKKWSDYECAAPYIEAVESAIDAFALDRAFEDGDPSPRATGWKPKRARVELFVETFSTPEKLHAFMTGDFDFEQLAVKVREINETLTSAQMRLPV